MNEDDKIDLPIDLKEFEKLINEPDHEELLRSESEILLRRLYANFQIAAVNTSQLYKDKHFNAASPWFDFQNAARAVTLLYKDGVEIQKRISDLGIHTGYQRLTKELSSWLKKKSKKSHIKKKDVLAFLLTRRQKSASYNSKSSPKHRSSNLDSHLRGASIQRYGEADCEMNTFKDAVAVSNLSGALSGISVSSKRSNSSSSSGRHHRHSSGNSSSSGASCSIGSKSQELHPFLNQQFSMNMKRSSNSDIFDDSSKRSRLG
ncbi:UPF0472 protein C16orf72 [Nymphon striatum]|nr:UPF0472 protein C16orf72 [Nymphon striatum]